MKFLAKPLRLGDENASFTCLRVMKFLAKPLLTKKLNEMLVGFEGNEILS